MKSSSLFLSSLALSINVKTSVSFQILLLAGVLKIFIGGVY